MMKRTLLAILITAAAIYPSAPLMIPLTDRATYDFLEYLNTSRVINIPFTGVKPYRSDDIYQILTGIEEPDPVTERFIASFKEKYISGEEKFGSTTSKNSTAWFDPYLNQSHIQQNASEKPLYRKKSIYSWLGATDRDLNYSYPDISQSVTDGGIRGYISYKDFISLYTESGIMIKHNHKAGTDDMRDEYRTLVLVPSGGMADFSSEDYTMTVFTVSGEDIYFTFGKYPVSMGSGMINSATVSPIDSYYENFMFSFGGKRVRFTTLTGFLLADQQTRREREGWRWNKREKFLSAHRLEWRVMNNLALGANSMIISGDRPIEPGYLFPILPLRWMEHYYGDLDNALVSVDFKYSPARNFTLYGELLIDDESHTKSWTGNYVNKWAINAGILNTNFLTLKNLSFNFEFSRVEPYVYGHKVNINRYMNLDEFLSIPAGPDSETLNFRLKYFLDHNKHITAGYTRENRGEPVWAYWTRIPWHKIDGKVFLRGTVEKTSRFYTELHYAYNKYISADIYYSHTRIENYNHNLPPYDQNWLERYEDPANDYASTRDYYEREIVPAKTQQNYTNNTFSLRLNIVFKNYLSSLFGKE